MCKRGSAGCGSAQAISLGVCEVKVRQQTEDSKAKQCTLGASGNDRQDDDHALGKES